MLNTYTLWQPIHRVFILQNCNSLPIKKLTPYFPLFPASGQLSFCLCSFGILQGSHISEIIQYLSFCYRLVSVNTVALREFLCVLACVRVSFLFKAEWCSIIYIDSTFCLPSHALMDRVASAFCMLWIMLLWTLVCKCLLETLLSVLLDKCQVVEIAVSHVNSIFKFLKNCNNVFYTTFL